MIIKIGLKIINQANKNIRKQFIHTKYINSYGSYNIKYNNYEFSEKITISINLDEYIKLFRPKKKIILFNPEQELNFNKDNI